MGKLFLLAVLLTHLPAYAVSVPGERLWPFELFLQEPQTGQLVSLETYLERTPREYRQITGKKMKLAEKISLKINQHRLKKCIRKDGTVNITKLKRIMENEFQFNFGGFMLGLLFWLPGVLIAALIDHKKKPKNMLSSAIIGAVCITFLGSIVIAIGSVFAGMAF